MPTARNPLRHCAAAAAAALLTACSSAQPKPPAPSPFPAQQFLDQLPAVVPEALPAGVAASRVLVWDMAGAAPATYSLAAPDQQNPVTALLLRRALETKGLLLPSQSLDCYAAEAARILAEHGQPPEGELGTFVATRCGIAGFQVQLRWRPGRGGASCPQTQVKTGSAC